MLDSCILVINKFLTHFGVCSVNSIFYWKDVQKGISELFRVLNNGGLLTLCFTSRSSLENKEFAQKGLRLFDPGDVQQIMESCGFQDINIKQSSDKHRDFFIISGYKI